jgi:chorismate mutase/prephenate dehydratase
MSSPRSTRQKSVRQAGTPAKVGQRGQSGKAGARAGAHAKAGAGANASADAKAGALPGLDLSALRSAIDRLDGRIVSLLNQRSKLVVKVGRYKQARGIPIYAPHREQEVLGRVLAHNAGPLQGRTIEAIYRELMSGSFALEQPLKIGYLGPAGSFSHVAAVKQFGQSVAFENLREIAGVFTEVERGHVDYGLVPIENSIHGGVAETLDAFAERAGKIHVYAEVQLAIHHALMANCAPSRIKRIYSKPEVFSQCRTWLATQYPQAELVSVASSSKGAQMAAEESERLGADCTSAAIGNALAGELYDLSVLFPRIEDNPHNITRFFVISRQQAQPSGDDKTSVMFRTLNKPGALVHVLQVFERAGVNLTHIDKRPAGRVNWQYTFFIDAQGHQTLPALARALRSARKHCQELWVLGSYPRSKRIL